MSQRRASAARESLRRGAAGLAKTARRASKAAAAAAAAAATTRKPGTEEPADNEIVRFQGLSVRELEKFWLDVVEGRQAADVDLVVAEESLADGALAAGQTMRVVDRLSASVLVCRAPYDESENAQTGHEVHASKLRQKPRDEWTIEDVCEYAVLPLTRKAECFFLDLVEPHAVGRHFQGAFVSQARSSPMHDLVRGLVDHFASQGLPLEDAYVWIDIFSANQALLARRAADDTQAKVQAARMDLLSASLHEAIRCFDATAILFDSWVSPAPLRRAWCVWEIYGAALGKKPLEILFGESDEDASDSRDSVQPLQSLPSWLRAGRGGDDIIAALAALDMRDMECRNQDDLCSIPAAVERLEGGFSTLKASITKRLTRCLVDQARAAVEREERRGATSRTDVDFARMLMAAGTFLRHMGDLEPALEYFGKACRIFIVAHGPVSQGTRAAIGNMGNIRRDQGRYKEAIELYEKVLSLDRVILGERDAAVADTLTNLGLVHERIGAYDQALALYSEALSIRREILGDHHELVADVINNMAIVHQLCGGYEEAFGLYSEALLVYRETLGDRHPAVADALNNIGGVKKELGEYAEALEYFEEALQIKREVIGGTHFSIAESLGNIAVIKVLQGNYEEAVGIFEEARSMYVEVLGTTQHPTIADTMTNLAAAKAKCGDLDEARRIHQEALDVKLALLGESHPGVATSLFNLSFVDSEQNDLVAALANVEQAFRIWRRAFGPRHPQTVQAQDRFVYLLELVKSSHVP